MPFIADFHIHSKYSRATSHDLCFESLAVWGKRKGVSVIGTGDCTHPAWIAEMERTLTPDGDGLFRLKNDVQKYGDIVVPASCTAPVHFMITGEISTIYKYGDATRKVHHLICLPDLVSAVRFNRRLERIGNIASDGRPILGLDSRDLLETLLEVSDKAVLIPAHIWTPWFSVLGSKSGFDSIDECYRDLSSHIFAVETGLSSDPPMNWMVSALDRFSLVSNSDAHSALKIGREANIFECDMGYPAIMDSLKKKGSGFWGTLEFFPEEGKYHYDGHRDCKVCLGPDKSRELGGKCPVCGSPLTLGVEYRVTELADRPKGTVPAGAQKFKSMVSLAEILGEIEGAAATSKKVVQQYEVLLEKIGPEIPLLLNAEHDQIVSIGGEVLAAGIDAMRKGTIHAKPGYDGEFGTISVFTEEERNRLLGQTTLFPLGAPRKSRADAPGATLVPSGKKKAPSAIKKRIKNELNPQQQAAVDHANSPLIITAGPGTGKTKTIVSRMVNQITSRSIAPSSILAITFSNRAAAELSRRCADMLPGTLHNQRPVVTTFHKFGYRLICEHAGLFGFEQAPSILSEDDAARLLDKAYDLCGIPATNIDPEGLLLECLGDPAVSFEQIPALIDALAEPVPTYQRLKTEARSLDFCDLLLLPLVLLATHTKIRTACQTQFSHIYVDEYQDVNALQYHILRLLCSPQSDICVIGDPDQAIYAFRGADPRYFLRFTQDYPNAVSISLTKNYRCSQTILNAARQIIAPCSKGNAHELTSTIAGSLTIEVVHHATVWVEAAWVLQTIEGLIGGTSHYAMGRTNKRQVATNLGFGDIAILYRNHAAGDAIERELVEKGIPIQRALRKDLFTRSAVKRALSILTFIDNPHHHEHLDAFVKLIFPDESREVCGQVSTSIVSLSSGRDSLSFDERIRTLQSSISQTLSTLESLHTKGQIAELFSTALHVAGVPENEHNAHPYSLLHNRASECPSIAEFCTSCNLERDIDMNDPRAERISLMTIHAAKGLEWDTVIIVGCENGLLPSHQAPLEEERRLMFVAATRAKRALICSWCESRTIFGKKQAQAISPFLLDIPIGCVSMNSQMEKKKGKKEIDSVQLELF